MKQAKWWLVTLIIVFGIVLPIWGAFYCLWYMDTPPGIKIVNNTDLAIQVWVYEESPENWRSDFGVLAPGQSESRHLFDNNWHFIRRILVFAMDMDGHLVFYRSVSPFSALIHSSTVTISDEPAWHGTPNWDENWGEPFWNTG